MDSTLTPTVPYLTTRAHKVFALAHDIADRLGHEVSPVHLTIAILRHQGVPAGALHNLRVPLNELENEVTHQLPVAGTPREVPTHREWTPWDNQMVEQARGEARVLGTEFYSSEHLLLALLRNGDCAPAKILAKFGVQYDDLRREISRGYDLSQDGPAPGHSSPAI